MKGNSYRDALYHVDFWKRCDYWLLAAGNLGRILGIICCDLDFFRLIVIGGWG